MKTLSVALLSLFFVTPAFSEDTVPAPQVVAIPASPVSNFPAKSGIGWNGGNAYNSTNNEYLIVWSQSISNQDPVDYSKIYAQRLKAESGEKAGDMLQISSPDMIVAYEPSVAYNPKHNEYMITWRGQHGPDSKGMSDTRAIEVYVQRLNAATGEKIGGNIRISDVGFDNPGYPGKVDPVDGEGDTVNSPEIIYNSINDQYFVAWWGDDEFLKSTNPNSYYNDWEIFGQRIDASGNEIGANDFQVSITGAPEDTSLSPKFPALAYNSKSNQYLVVWNIPNKGVYARAINAANGTFLGPQFELDDTTRIHKPTDVPPTVVYNPDAGQYLVAWNQYSYVSETDPAKNYHSNGMEVFAVRLDSNNFSALGPITQISGYAELYNDQAHSIYPKALYDPFRHQYIVTWDAGPYYARNYMAGQLVSVETGEKIRNVDYFLTSTPSVSALPGMYVFTESSTALNVNKEGLMIGFGGWADYYQHQILGIWGQRVDATVLDEMTIQATPTPTTSPTPPLNNDNHNGHGQNGDLSVLISKSKDNSYNFSCVYTGSNSTEQFKLTIYRSASKTLVPKKSKKLKAIKSKVKAGVKLASAKMSLKKDSKNKMNYLIAQCQSENATSTKVLVLK
jgi:hypothetical protein